jgi:hypothetical protein
MGPFYRYAFIEFESPEVARLACEKTQGHKLDKQHIFAVNLYSDFEKLMAVPDEYVPPQVKDHEEGVRFNIQLSFYNVHFVNFQTRIIIHRTILDGGCRSLEESNSTLFVRVKRPRFIGMRVSANPNHSTSDL